MSESQQKAVYTQTYEQFNLLGRGAYGSAYLVKNRIDDTFYVAKKMMLEGMGEKDKAAAWGEIQILKKFNEMRIPFIVEYKECFHFQNTLIIVMEYCEHGDLTTFLKNWKKKGELLDEKVIVNWFIQLLFGVKALHSKNVLHRDLKSANVFLTSNKTLKIGDFGISKVLDNTSAKTFVGTPYYLSPQVCQNRPYSLSSDLWSLGCVIYEMCTLSYPFQGSNLLGLAMKILTQQVKPLPSQYSPQLNTIVMKLFIKNEKQRITIDEILKMPFIKKHMATFVEDQQKINKLIIIGKKQIKPQEEEQEAKKSIKKQEDDNEDTMKTINTMMQKTKGKETTLSYSQSLTPTQRMKLNKEQETLRRQEEVRQEIVKNANTQNFAKEKKYQNLSSSGAGFNNGNNGRFAMTNNSQTLGSTFNKSIELQRQFQHQNRQKAELKMTKQRLQKMQVINTQELLESINQMMTKKSPSPVYQQDHPNVKTINQSMKNTYIDERPIKPSKNCKYQVEQEIYQQNDDDYDYQNNGSNDDNEELEEYYDEGFEDYIEEQSPKVKSTATKEEFQDIKAFYDDYSGKAIVSPTKKSKIAQVFKNQQITIPTTPQKRISSKIQKCKEQVGQKKYNQLYKKVKNQEINYKTMKSQYSGDQINAIHMIEEIVYEEGRV